MPLTFDAIAISDAITTSGAVRVPLVDYNYAASAINGSEINLYAINDNRRVPEFVEFVAPVTIAIAAYIPLYKLFFGGDYSRRMLVARENRDMAVPRENRTMVVPREPPIKVRPSNRTIRT